MVLSPERWRQEVGTRAAEAVQRVVVVVQQLGDILYSRRGPGYELDIG